MAYVKGSALAEDVTTGDLLLAHEVPLLELRQQEAGRLVGAPRCDFVALLPAAEGANWARQTSDLLAQRPET